MQEGHIACIAAGELAHYVLTAGRSRTILTIVRWRRATTTVIEESIQSAAIFKRTKVTLVLSILFMSEAVNRYVS